jgi:hypothetical protein
MAMIVGGPQGMPGGGAIVLGQAARGFGGAMFQALRGGVVGPQQPIQIQMPTGGMNAASAAAMTAIATQFGLEAKAYIEEIKPYVKGSFWAFAIILVLVITEKVYNGPLGAVIGAAAKSLLAILRAGAPVAASGTVKFLKAVGRLLKALRALPGDVRNAILERVVAIQNYAHQKIRTVREGLVVVRGYVKRTRNAVVGTMRRSLARVTAAGVRIRTAARSARAAVGGFRGHLKARAKAKVNAATMARNQKIRTNLAAINQRVVSHEEKRIRNLINKVKKTSAPLSAKEKREYLALTRKAEKNAMRNAAAAHRNITMANREAGKALMNLSGRKSH